MSSNRQSLKDFIPGEQIDIAGTRYTFVARPGHPESLQLDQGSQGAIAKLKSDTGRFVALKSLKPKYQKADIVERCSFIREFSAIPGMEAAEIEVINPNLSKYENIVQAYSFLRYAVIMPWLPYPTWSELRYYEQNGALPVPDYLTCRKRALSLAHLLDTLNSRCVAHCDICPGNVIINPHGDSFLIDFENVFHPRFSPPSWGYITGQSGYRHKAVPQRPDKQWCLIGDRFGGALLISELLTWYDPQVRELSGKEYYVEQAHLHDSSTLQFKALCQALERVSKQVEDLFLHAWTSQTLEECPQMGRWIEVLTDAPDILPVLLPTKHFVRRVVYDRHDVHSDQDNFRPKTENQRVPKTVAQSETSKHVSSRKVIQHTNNNVSTVRRSQGMPRVPLAAPSPHSSPRARRSATNVTSSRNTQQTPQAIQTFVVLLLLISLIVIGLCALVAYLT